MDIEIRNLHRSFGSRKVLQGVDLSFSSGQTHVILGGSGTGKSVLIKHIVGLLRPDEGEIVVDGQDITKLRERELYPIRRRMSYIFQGGALLNSMTVGENVGLALRERGKKSKKEVKQIVAEKLEMVDLAGREDDSPSSLSGGQRKRVAVARALAPEPEVLFYDEPTAGLDPPTAANIDQLINDVAQKTGATSIVVTHDMLSVFAVADIVHLLHKGKIGFEGTLDELRHSELDYVHQFIDRDSKGARFPMLQSGEFSELIQDEEDRRERERLEKRDDQKEKRRERKGPQPEIAPKEDVVKVEDESDTLPFVSADDMAAGLKAASGNVPSSGNKAANPQHEPTAPFMSQDEIRQGIADAKGAVEKKNDPQLEDTVPPPSASS